MGRPPGSPNKPGGAKPGRKEGRTRLPILPDEQIREFKEEILRLIGLGEMQTLSEAARSIGLNPANVHNWAVTDPDFAKAYNQAREVVADEIEKWLLESNHVIAKIFLLKGLRPMYRDSYKTFEIRDERTQELLKKLVELGKQTETKVEEEKPSELAIPAQTLIDNPFAAVIEKVKEKCLK